MSVPAGAGLPRRSGGREPGDRRCRLAALLCLAVLAVSRYPFIHYGFELNKDESQMMALSMRMVGDWVPWSAASTETNGPFLTAFLSLFRAAGLPVTYPLVHFWAVLAHALTLFLGWRVGARLAGERAALAGLAAVALTLAASVGGDFVHFSTELFPMLFLAAGLLTLVGEGGRAVMVPWRLFAGGFLVGLVPWAKLQAGPLALAVCAWLAFSLAQEPGPGAGRWKRALSLLALAAAGVWTPTLLMLLTCALGGSLGLMWDCYFVFNLAYAGERSLGALLDALALLATVPWVTAFLWLALLALPLSGAQLFAAPRRAGLFLVLALVGAGLYAVARSQYPFPHYQILLLAPCELACALFAAGLTRGDGWRGLPLVRLGRVFLPAALLCLCLVQAVQGNREGWAMALGGPPQAGLPASQLSDRVAAVVPRGGTLLVWGWHPGLYVDLDAKPATRYGHHGRLVIDSPAREHLRRCFLEDLQASAPGHVVLMDDGFWFGRGNDRPFPELQAYLDAHYEPAGAGAQFSVLRRKD